MSAAFVYPLSHSIKVPGTNKVGRITGRAEFLDNENQYCVEWTEQTGAAMRWFTEPELTGAVVAGTEPDATAMPLTTIPPESAGANTTNIVQDTREPVSDVTEQGNASEVATDPAPEVTQDDQQEAAA